MSLTGKTNAQKIWNYLRAKGLSPAGAAGVMGNLNAESALKANNLQNSYQKKLGYTDASYTKAVDDGTYTNFIHDAAGYGLAQWTYHTRKAALLSLTPASPAATPCARITTISAPVGTAALPDTVCCPRHGT